jgi:hypothetical protein
MTNIEKPKGKTLTVTVEGTADEIQRWQEECAAILADAERVGIIVTVGEKVLKTTETETEADPTALKKKPKFSELELLTGALIEKVELIKDALHEYYKKQVYGSNSSNISGKNPNYGKAEYTYQNLISQIGDLLNTFSLGSVIEALHPETHGDFRYFQKIMNKALEEIGNPERVTGRLDK